MLLRFFNFQNFDLVPYHPMRGGEQKGDSILAGKHRFADNVDLLATPAVLAAQHISPIISGVSPAPDSSAELRAFLMPLRR
jgi:hypothetical protein